MTSVALLSRAIRALGQVMVAYSTPPTPPSAQETEIRTISSAIGAPKA
jgi:hypothetical protein